MATNGQEPGRRRPEPSAGAKKSFSSKLFRKRETKVKRESAGEAAQRQADRVDWEKYVRFAQMIVRMGEGELANVGPSFVRAFKKMPEWVQSEVLRANPLAGKYLR